MDPRETKKPRTLEQFELAPGTSQYEQQDNPDQDSEFVQIYIELVTHLKVLDAQNEMGKVQGRASKEQFSDNPNSEPGPSCKHLEAGNKQGDTSSGIATHVKSPSDLDKPLSAGDEKGDASLGASPANLTSTKSSFDLNQSVSAGDEQGDTSLGDTPAILTSMKLPIALDQPVSAGDKQGDTSLGASPAILTSMKSLSMKSPFDLNQPVSAGDEQGDTSSGASPAILTSMKPPFDLNQPAPAGDKQGNMISGASPAILTSMKSSSNPDKPDSAGLIPSRVQKIKEPTSIVVIDSTDSPATLVDLTDTVSPAADRPSSGTTGGKIDVPLVDLTDTVSPVADIPSSGTTGDKIDVPLVGLNDTVSLAADIPSPGTTEGKMDAPLVDLTDTVSPAADIPSPDTTGGKIDSNHSYIKGESENVLGENADTENLEEVSDEQIIKDEEEQIKILKEVLDGTDEQVKDELKSQLVGQSPPQDHVHKKSLYALCEESLKILKQCFTKARGPTFWYLGTIQKIMKDAGKLNWLVDVLVEREIAQDFVMIWASQSDTSNGYYKFAAEDRHELSRITATLLGGIGERKVYANQEARYALLKTWLLPLSEDIVRRYEWSGIDLESIEYGLVGTIFSLPEPMQHEILSDWVDKHSGDKWPPLLAWYELWWSKPFKKMTYGA